MKPTIEQLRMDPRFSLVPPNQIPAPVVYRDSATGNCFFVAPDDQGNLCVLDQFVELRDKGGVLGFQKRPRRGIEKMFDNVLNGLASVVILIGDPRLDAILKFAGKAKLAKSIKDKIAGLADKMDQSKLAELLADLGQNEALLVFQAVEAALADGTLTPEEFAEIKALASKFKAG